MDRDLKNKCDEIAQRWFWSCDAPDTTATAREASRLSKLIYDVMNGAQDRQWKVVKHYLFDAIDLQD